MKKTTMLFVMLLMSVLAINNVFAQTKVVVGKQTIKVPGKKVTSDSDSGSGTFNYYADINAKTLTFSQEQLSEGKKTETIQISTLKVANLKNEEVETLEQKMGENIPTMYVVTVQGAIPSTKEKTNADVTIKKYFSYSDSSSENTGQQMSCVFKTKAEADKLCAEINKIIKARKK